MPAGSAGALAGTEVRIAVVGDYQRDHETHPATTAAIGHAARSLGVAAAVAWEPTESLSGGADRLRDVDGVWIAPGSPYRSLDGALAAITVAREGGLPLLGTCAGFQHLVLEYARNVMGLAQAAHAEYDPGASVLFVTPLSCSLVGQTFRVAITAGSRAAAAYGTSAATERYYCNFGLNPHVVDALSAAGLSITGTDGDGEPRIVELPGHPFFVGTLFVPQVASSAEHPHPLVRAFMRAVAEHARAKAGPLPDGEATGGAVSGGRHG